MSVKLVKNEEFEKLKKGIIPAGNSNEIAHYTINATSFVCNPGGNPFYSIPMYDFITNPAYNPCVIATNGDHTTYGYSLIAANVDSVHNSINFMFDRPISTIIRINYMIFYKNERI